MTNHSAAYVWEQMEYSDALRYYALHWIEENAKRQLFCFGKVPELRVVKIARQTQSDEIV